MKFAQVFKISLKYRWSILFTILTGLGVGLTWGANLSAVYPFMEITFKGQSMQGWIAEMIKTSEQRLSELDATAQELAALPPAEQDSRQLELIEHQRKTESTTLGWYRWLRPWIDKYLPTSAFKTIVVLLAALLAMTVLKLAFLIANTMFVTRITNRTIYEVRNQLFDKCLELDLARYNRDGSAELMSRITNDVGGISNGLSVIFGKLIREPLKMFVCLGIAIWINWQLFVVTALVLPPIGWAIGKLSHSIKKVSRQIMEQTAVLFQRMQEAFFGIKIVKCFSMEPHVRQQFQQQGEVLYRKSFSVAFLDVLAKSVVEFSGILVVSVALLVGAWLVLSGNTHLCGFRMSERPLSIEWLVMFYVALLGAADPARKLSDIFTSIQNTFAACDRIYDLMQTPVQIQEPTEPMPLETATPDLVFQHVSFDYEVDRPVLRDVDFTVPFGRTVAIVGANGCGKSTLLNLIPRLADPTQGEILLGGVPLTRLWLKELHDQIGLVSQDTILFDDTVMNNIRFGRFDATDEEVIAAAKKAFAHPFITEVLPQGYDTPLGPHGNLLSGGQKQRIALARVILREPKLLLLDEATSQIDLESERSINEALAEFHKDRTVVIVTHRLSILEIADEIFVMEAGRIIASGTHDQLMRSCAFYQNLHQGGATGQ